VIVQKLDIIDCTKKAEKNAKNLILAQICGRSRRWRARADESVRKVAVKTRLTYSKTASYPAPGRDGGGSICATVARPPGGGFVLNEERGEGAVIGAAVLMEVRGDSISDFARDIMAAKAEAFEEE
jgi:hypothetical protein